MAADYQALVRELAAAGIREGHYQWYGLILGWISRGLEPSGGLLGALSSIMNGGEPLPGSAAAALTGLALDARGAWRSGADARTLLAFPDRRVPAPERLRVLSDLCCGLTLGLTCGDDGFTRDKPAPGLLEDLRSLSALSEVDTAGQLEEEDLDAVLEFIRRLLLSRPRD